MPYCSELTLAEISRGRRIILANFGFSAFLRNDAADATAVENTRNAAPHLAFCCKWRSSCVTLPSIYRTGSAAAFAACAADTVAIARSFAHAGTRSCLLRAWREPARRASLYAICITIGCTSTCTRLTAFAPATACGISSNIACFAASSCCCARRWRRAYRAETFIGPTFSCFGCGCCCSTLAGCWKQQRCLRRDVDACAASCRTARRRGRRRRVCTLQRARSKASFSF